MHHAPKSRGLEITSAFPSATPSHNKFLISFSNSFPFEDETKKRQKVNKDVTLIESKYVSPFGKKKKKKLFFQKASLCGPSQRQVPEGTTSRRMILRKIHVTWREDPNFTTHKVIPLQSEKLKIKTSLIIG